MMALKAFSGSGLSRLGLATYFGGNPVESLGLLNLQTRCLMKLVMPPNYDGITIPERNKLKFMDKTPNYPVGIKPPKMFKNLKFMRGPEPYHNELHLKQYGVIATGPGRLRHGHFEMMRLTIGREMDAKRMFAIWRIDAPWQPITKKGQGKRMGGGKGAIDHYVTPIKHGRVIVEVGGHCEFSEVQRFLNIVAHNLPFKAEVVSYDSLNEKRQAEIDRENSNSNPYTLKYVFKNNLGKSHLWVSPNDRKYFGKHI